MLITAGILLIPRKGKLLENILMVGYPMVWVTIYMSLGCLDELQLHIYWYLSAEVVLLFIK